MRRGRGEAGQVGGLEGLVFGVLVFVFGTLLVVNAWAVVDAKSAAAAAAREATRSYVESSVADDADTRAREAGMAAFEGHGRSRDGATVVRTAGTLDRCSRVVYEAAYVVPLLQVPLVGGIGRGFRVSARHSEVVDPYRSGLGHQAADCG
ncbi:MAG TPA: hypothetical protein VM938_02760 [Acidimicrobiales bacterium]|nr:hypothetical protein [Acidimicrobiales bacterium]